MQLKGKTIKHFVKESELAPESIVLYSKHGPLLYKTYRGDGTVWVMPDSALLTNEFLRQDKAALFFNRLLRPYFGKRIYICRNDLLSSRNSQKTTPLLALLFKDKLLFITLQLLWILALFMARQGKRFGEPQLLDPYARRTLSEHLKAIGHFYQKTGQTGIVDEINGEYFKHMLTKFTGLQWKDNPSLEEIEQIKTRLAATNPDITREQILESLKKEPRLSTSRLIVKAKIQEKIIKQSKFKNQKPKGNE